MISVLNLCNKENIKNAFCISFFRYHYINRPEETLLFNWVSHNCPIRPRPLMEYYFNLFYPGKFPFAHRNLLINGANEIAYLENIPYKVEPPKLSTLNSLFGRYLYHDDKPFLLSFKHRHIPENTNVFEALNFLPGSKIPYYNPDINTEVVPISIEHLVYDYTIYKNTCCPLEELKECLPIK